MKHRADASHLFPAPVLSECRLGILEYGARVDQPTAPSRVPDKLIDRLTTLIMTKVKLIAHTVKSKGSELYIAMTAAKMEA